MADLNDLPSLSTANLDSWADTGPGTFLTEAQARALLDGLQLLHFRVQDHDGMAFSRPKHWHVFDVIARRPAT